MILELFSILQQNRVSGLPPLTNEIKQEMVLQEVLKGKTEKIKELEELIDLTQLHKKQEEIKKEEERKQPELKRNKPQYRTSNYLTKSKGLNYFKKHRETYYNLPMQNVIRLMKPYGYTLKDYWVREDGVKMLGDYIMVAANYKIYPKGSLLETSLGMGIVVDTGAFVNTYPHGIDIAVVWK